MSTQHTIHIARAQNMDFLSDQSVDLVVTSPPYPMIEMWDQCFNEQNHDIGDLLTTSPLKAFELMHKELDKVWHECYRVLKNGGFLCINIGDATRTINKEFRLFNNHSRIVNACMQAGFVNLPGIIWRKQTNAPNKFMGSGMLPCGAYVTLEHEWILIFRKGEKRTFNNEDEKRRRRESSFFWEERNVWFSDLWEIKGVKQKMEEAPSRERNASFPMEVPFRLINMYSQKSDTVLDPFYGLGTTSVAAMLTERNSIGVEIDSKLQFLIEKRLSNLNIDTLNDMILKRYKNHLNFINERECAGKEVKYVNEHMKCKVMTSQEVDMCLHYIEKIEKDKEKSLTFTGYYIHSMEMNEYENAKAYPLFYTSNSIV